MKRLLCILFVCVCSFAFAQTATTDIPVDTAKVDSFFKTRSVNIYNAVNPAMYYEIYRWLNTCYRYGGNSDAGIDCSHFVNMLYEKFYGVKLEGGSASIFPKCIPFKSLDDAMEGDLVFFKIKKGQISHIAIYLQNGRFAHATTRAGVIISSIEEPYYKKYYYRAGRLKQ
jgi:lipoprotein Spr